MVIYITEGQASNCNSNSNRQIVRSYLYDKQA